MMIGIDQVTQLIQTKAKTGYSGKITLVFKGGMIENVEKSQDMNPQRVAREINRDKNHLLQKSKWPET